MICIYVACIGSHRFHVSFTYLFNNYVYQTISRFTPVIEPSGMSGFYMDMKGLITPKRNIKDIGFSVLGQIDNRVR